MFVKKYPGLIFIDSGAEINHISEQIGEQARPRTKLALYQVQVSYKSTENMKVTPTKLQLALDHNLGRS